MSSDLTAEEVRQIEIKNTIKWLNEIKEQNPDKTLEELYYNTKIRAGTSMSYCCLVDKCIIYGIEEPIKFTQKFEDLEKEYLVARQAFLSQYTENPFILPDQTIEGNAIIEKYLNLQYVYISRGRIRKNTGNLEY